MRERKKCYMREWESCVTERLECVLRQSQAR